MLRKEVGVYPAIFGEFARMESVSDGVSVYDFLGGAITAAYKKGWGKNVVPAGKVVKPGYPAPSEWTIDWIACLLAARFAGNRFSVVELGAGYGQWMVVAIMAYKARKPDCPVHGMAVEAERAHYEWLQCHVEKNLAKYDKVRTDLLFAAAGYDGTVRFPVVHEPDATYGAGYGSRTSGEASYEVECLSMEAIDSRFGEESIDLLHVDIQGAEEDLIVSPGFEEALKKTRFVLFGTHKSDELHGKVRKSVESAGLKVLLEWPRNSLVKTPFGEIRTNDGAVLATTRALAIRAEAFLDPIEIQ